MSAIVDFGGIQATIDGYVWKCKHGVIEDYLNSLLSPTGAITSDPNPDYNAALDAVDKLGGKVVRYDKMERKKGRVY